MIDFPKINPAHHGVEHCIYYAVEWMHNGREFGSWALRKHNLCNDTVQYYYEPSSYVSEGVFVPTGGPAEDDGVVLLVSSSGLTNASSFVILDAKTMHPLHIFPLPHGWMVCTWCMVLKPANVVLCM